MSMWKPPRLDNPKHRRRHVEQRQGHLLLYGVVVLLSSNLCCCTAFASPLASSSCAPSSSSSSLATTSFWSAGWKPQTTLFSIGRGGSSVTEEPQPKRTVLVTGGAGYIGSHTCVELIQSGLYRVVVIDTLDNSSKESLNRVKELTHCSDDDLQFRQCDVRDSATLTSVLNEFGDITSCIHFAGLKAVGESVAKPLEYYDCNVGGTTHLLQTLAQRGIRHFVFSSSATVYGDPDELPIAETASLQATNPYGRTKLFIEEILRDAYAAQPDFWNIMILRYFNPIGAHPSGRMGEDPQGLPNNLMPFVAQVCVGRREKLSVFGNDYDTPDGTGVRDYIHVVDLARGHVAALDKLYQADSNDEGSCQVVNLGTGNGVSVLELVEGMAQATGKPVPYEMAPRRPGDVAALYADATRAATLLQWKAKLGLQDMCRDTWKWQSTNPYGYRTPQQVQDEQEQEEAAAAASNDETVLTPKN